MFDTIKGVRPSDVKYYDLITEEFYTVTDFEEINKSSLFSSDSLTNLNENVKKIDYTKSETKFDSGAYLSIEASSISLEKDCDDVDNPNQKTKYDFKVEKA